MNRTNLLHLWQNKCCWLRGRGGSDKELPARGESSLHPELLSTEVRMLGRVKCPLCVNVHRVHPIAGSAQMMVGWKEGEGEGASGPNYKPAAELPSQQVN